MPRRPSDPNEIMREMLSEMPRSSLPSMAEAQRQIGVLESREIPPPNRWERPIEVRTTPLFDRLLRFEL